MERITIIKSGNAIVLLSRLTGFVPSGNLSDFDVVREIVGNARVTNENEEICTWPKSGR